MNDWPDNHIAAQALKALRLRRQLERGDLTHQEYLACLNALQATPDDTAGHASEAMAHSAHETDGGKSGQTASAPRPQLIGALELLQLRRRLENGQLTPQEYLAQLAAPQDTAHPPAPEPAPLPTSTPTVQPVPAATAVPMQAPPERYLAMKCPRCVANLRIYDQTTELQCSDCGADIMVERKDCTIALRLPEEPDKIAAPAASARIEEEIKELLAEAAMVTNVKRAAGILGGLCGLVFAYTGIVDMAARQIAMGTSILFCGSALLGIVVCITRHTNKVKADLTLQIRAISQNEEYAAEHP